MTYEEALAIVEVCGLNIVETAHSKVAELVFMALEKQIPKKPTYEGDGYDESGSLIYDHAECPACGNDDFEYGINNWGCKFCPECGQALDWSDTE